ncbi:unnamed protein product [Prorocentrum cordatum]|uniref:Uncharacterized protein n=1 Tax=Prorocentrum cordatum TaxID=2364126 RepID=A0ABN9XGH0_9DINO|nr:unnamed protein product [Polarella glacialis]|mmetsp:Transcript_7633/g.20424  ORF Transcript_7633/g.20424 Transcript_7633/m.20424 type:complete len:274 (+) Transcript_7633:85-906(+)
MDRGLLGRGGEEVEMRRVVSQSSSAASRSGLETLGAASLADEDYRVRRTVPALALAAVSLTVVVAFALAAAVWGGSGRKHVVALPATVRMLGTCGGASGEAAAAERGGGEKCFCLFTGHCLDLWNCGEKSVEQCQRESCQDRVALEITETAATFYNMKDHQDLLTIPVSYHETIVSMIAACPGGEAEGLLTSLLDAGRRVFVEAGVGGPGTVEAEMQCVHLPSTISVHWLHVHTFIGEVGNGEGLPARPPDAVCAPVNLTSAEAARHMLAHAA